MSTDRTAALALLAGSLAGLMTMALHPTGRDVVHNAAVDAPITLVTTMHTVALLAQSLLLTGALGVTRRLRARRDVAVAAYVGFALAGVAVVIAAAASGFVAPSVLRGFAEADASTRAMMLHALRYTGLVNQAFAKIHVMFGAAAIALWSAAMLGGREFPRALGAYGVLLGVALTLGLTTGHLHLDVHGFGAVVLGEGIWFAWAAAQLWRAADRPS